MADNSKPIISSKQSSRNIRDINTEVVCSNFGNRLFILVTQYGKIGTLVDITKEIDQAENPEIKVLMGKDEPLTYVFAKQIGLSVYASGVLRPILLAIALKDQTPETLKEVIQLIESNRVVHPVNLFLQCLKITPEAKDTVLLGAKLNVNT